MNTSDKDALHAAIMELRYEMPRDVYMANGIAQVAYRHGHRDARHAAAELVSASLVAPQEVRMLTGTEMDDCECATYPRTVRAIILKCAEIWGLSIKEQAVKPATQQEPK